MLQRDIIFKFDSDLLVPLVLDTFAHCSRLLYGLRNISHDHPRKKLRYWRQFGVGVDSLLFIVSASFLRLIPKNIL
jgi:hypothetical protein